MISISAMQLCKILAVRIKVNSFFCTVYTLLEELGGYLPPGALGPSDLTPLLGRLLRLNGAPLVDVRLEQDPTDPTKLTVFVDVPRRGGALGSLLAFRTQYQVGISPLWTYVSVVG